MKRETIDHALQKKRRRPRRQRRAATIAYSDVVDEIRNLDHEPISDHLAKMRGES